MIELMQKLNFPLLDIEPLLVYFRQFKKYKIIKEYVEKDNGEIDILIEDDLIKIIYLEITGGEFWSVYRYHSNGIKYEQIDVIVWDKIKEGRYNKVIKYSGHVEDDNYSYITCSGFSYLNGEITKSWKKMRVVPIQDLQKIQYSNNMNLTELIIMADNKSNNIVKKEEQQDIKTFVLKLQKV